MTTSTREGDARATDSLPWRGVLLSAAMTLAGAALVTWPIFFARAVLRSASVVDPDTLRPSWPAGEFTAPVMGVLAPLSFVGGCVLLFVGIGSVVVGSSPRLQRGLSRWNERQRMDEARRAV